MEEKIFNTQLEDKLKGINIPVTTAEESKTTLPGAKHVGAAAMLQETKDEMESKAEAIKKSKKEELKLKDRKRIIEQKINNLNFDIKELERDGKKGYEVLAKEQEDELRKLEKELESLSFKSSPNAEITAPGSENFGVTAAEKLDVSSKDVSTQEIPIVEKTTSEEKLNKSRPVFRIIPRAEKEKDQDLKNEFEQKYPNVLKTKRFNDQGDELCILDYKEGEVWYYLTRKGEKPSSKSKYMSLLQLEGMLREYTRVEEKLFETKETERRKSKDYSDFLKKYEEQGLTEFCDSFDEKTGDLRADGNHLSIRFNRGSGKVECTFTGKDTYKVEEIGLSELDELLKKYPYTLKIEDALKFRLGETEQAKENMSAEEKEAMLLYEKDAQKMLDFIKKIDYAGQYGYAENDVAELVKIQTNRYWKILEKDMYEEGAFLDNGRVSAVFAKIKENLSKV